MFFKNKITNVTDVSINLFFSFFLSFFHKLVFFFLFFPFFLSFFHKLVFFFPFFFLSFFPFSINLFFSFFLFFFSFLSFFFVFHSFFTVLIDDLPAAQQRSTHYQHLRRQQHLRPVAVSFPPYFFLSIHPIFLSFPTVIFYRKIITSIASLHKFPSNLQQFLTFDLIFGWGLDTLIDKSYIFRYLVDIGRHLDDFLCNR